MKPEKILTVEDLARLRDAAMGLASWLRETREQAARLAEALGKTEEIRAAVAQDWADAARRIREAGFHDLGHLRTALEEGLSWPEGYNP